MHASLTGAFLSIGLMTNFLSLKETFRISLQGKPIFGVSLEERTQKRKIRRNGKLKVDVQVAAGRSVTAGLFTYRLNKQRKKL